MDEHIKKAEEDAAQAESDSDWGFGNYFIDRAEAVEYAENCRQLAEWLKELKSYRERMPSYEAGYNDAKREIALSGEYERAYQRGKEAAIDEPVDEPVDAISRQKARSHDKRRIKSAIQSQPRF